MATSGMYVCTGGMQHLRLYYLPTGESIRSLSLGNEMKVSAVAFVPCSNINDEGRYIWVALEKGDIISADVQSGNSIAILERKNAHLATVMHLLRYHGSIWSLDENGGLKIWSPDDSNTTSANPTRFGTTLSLNNRPRSLRVGSRQERSAVAKGRLWLASGRSVEVYNPSNATTLFQQRMDLCGVAGNVTSFSVSLDERIVMTGHDDGRIVVWNGETCTRDRVVCVSIYKITALLVLPNAHVWVGYSTGKIQVLDTTPSSWVTLKDFVGHANSGGVSDIVLDDKSLLMADKMTVSTFSAESGKIRVWDGFLAADGIDALVKEKEQEFSAYRDICVFVGSWNIDASKPEALDGRPRDEQVLQEWFGTYCNPPPSILVIGFQELVDLESKKANAKQFFFEAASLTSSNAKNYNDHRFAAWQDRLVRAVREHVRAPYRLVQSQQLFGLLQCIFVLESDVSYIRSVESSQVKTGLGGFHGNKGGIATRLLLDDTSFCFINAHLAAHQNQVSARNSDAVSIRDGASFSSVTSSGVFEPGGNGSAIMDHENIIFSGDLNYRIDLPRDRVIEAIENRNWRLLLDYDQLEKQRVSNPHFGLRFFNEAPLDFAPTFKYDSLSHTYDSSEKKRVPAWCDRILHKGKWLQKVYARSECTISDHRPICGLFEVSVKQVDPESYSQWRKYSEQVVLQQTLGIVHQAKIDW